MSEEVILRGMVKAHHKDAPRTATIKEEKGCLYTGPATNYPKKCFIPKEQSITVLETKGDWIMIKYIKGNNEYVGWTKASYIG